MYHSLFVICLLINRISTDNHPCSSVHKKLNHLGLPIPHPNNHHPVSGLRICQGLINDMCCPQIYEDKIQNITAMELYQLFELHSTNLYERLIRLNVQYNETIRQVIESSRHETHFILQRISKQFYPVYRSSVDLFYNNLFRISSRNYQYDMKNNLDELFRNILRITIGLHDQDQSISPRYVLCLWKNQPFGNRLNLIARKLEIQLEKFFHLHDLLKLTIELLQVMSTSVTNDYHCIDSYMQLSYCNLCSGRSEFPCLSNCINVIESCLVNVTLINEIWSNFIDALGNVEYFNGIEKVFSSIGISIADALLAFFNSDGIQNRDIVDQCGSIPSRKVIFANDQKFDEQSKNSLSSSLFEQQLTSMKQSLEIYRSFWLNLPKEICQSNEISIANESVCWTGTSIAQNKNESIRMSYDKPLSLRLQWIFKEMKAKSRTIAYKPSISTTSMKNSLAVLGFKLNLTDDLDDYPTDNEFEYSDYAYEDTIDESTSTTTTTTRTTTTTVQSSSTSPSDDHSIDEMNTVSYYDYGEQDVYTDDISDDASAKKTSSISTTTTITRIPSYHQRRPVIWNINIDDLESLNSSSSSLSSFYLLIFFLALLT